MEEKLTQQNIEKLKSSVEGLFKFVHYICCIIDFVEIVLSSSNHPGIFKEISGCGFSADMIHFDISGVHIAALLHTWNQK